MELRLNKVRIAFPKIFEPEAFKGEGKPRYTARLLLPKTDPQVKTLMATIEQVAKEGWPKEPKFLASIQGNSNKFFLTDGDTATQDGYEGYWLLSAVRPASAGRPGVYNRDKSPLTEDDGVIYSGCHVNVILDIWAQTKDYPGIRCKLEGVQFYGDGEAFAGSTRVTADAFDVVEGSDADAMA